MRLKKFSWTLIHTCAIDYFSHPLCMTAHQVASISSIVTIYCQLVTISLDMTLWCRDDIRATYCCKLVKLFYKGSNNCGSSIYNEKTNLSRVFCFGIINCFVSRYGVVPNIYSNFGQLGIYY